MNLSRRQLFQAGTAAGLSMRAGYAQSQRPNILFIQTDDQRFDDMGCAGNRVIQTPHLDRLAGEGIRFVNAFVTTAICCSSRASVLTGQHMWRHGIRDFETPLSAAQLDYTYPVLLRKAGYRTAFLGKYAIGGAQSWRRRGTPSLSLPSDRFDYWFGFPQSIDFLQIVDGKKRHLTPLMVEKATDFLRSTPANQPFCMSLNLKEPHGPWNFFDPDRPNLYTQATIPAPTTFTRDEFEAQPEFLRRSLNGTATGEWPQDAAQRLLERKRTWYHLITGVDTAVGQIMSVLKDLHRDSNTVVIFTSDHGDFGGSLGLTGKWLMHDESIRVPLIIRDPRLPAATRGARREQMALNIDLAPTMLRLAGVPVPPVMHGQDLGPILSDPSARSREDWYYEHTYTPEDERPHIARSEGVRTARWKFIRYIDQTPRYEQLFDLVNDPLERHNLAGKPEHKETLTAMRTRWREIRRDPQ